MRNQLFTFLLSYTLATPVFAIYDLAAINITPHADGTTSFCFQIDTSQKEMYLALTTDYQNFLFFSPELTLTPWLPPTPPPVFLSKTLKPNCYGPFSNDSLQGLKLFAGVGNSFQEVIDRQQYLRIFDDLPTLTKEEKPWTVMVYMVGSTLEREKTITKGHASKDILEMLAGTRSLPNQVNVVLATGGSSREGWNTVKRSLVHNGQLYVLQDLGKQLMSNPQTLTDFVRWTKENFPAQHYALILWNHGGGTQGYGQDTSQSLNAQMMSLDQLHQAYQSIREVFERPLDIVIYDACVMASIEVAEITATVTDAMAGSVEVEPRYGLDYSYLFGHLNQAPPADGLTLGNIAKDGYIQYSQSSNSGNSFRDVPIAYSVLNLTLLPAFRDTLKQFALEFDQVLHGTFLSYEMLSRGIIRAPGYPLAKTGRLLNSLSGKTSGVDAIRIDLYNVLQTVSPDYPDLKEYSDQLRSLLDQLVVSYEGNLQDRIQAEEAILAKSGRVSLDITISDTNNDGAADEPTYLNVLPEAYRLLYRNLVYYDQKRREDAYNPEGEFVNIECPPGMTCAEAKWWELPASEVLGVDGYYGQLVDEVSHLYLIKSLYRSRVLESDLDIGVDGHQACQYQLCVSETTCEDLTVTEQNNQLMADISLNDSPAILTFCQGENDLWSVCSVVSQTQGIWGRADILYPGDSLTPTTLHFQADELTSQQGNSLSVGEEPVTLKTRCDSYTATVVASYYGASQQPQFETICDKGDCVCAEGDPVASCQATHFQFKAGVRLKVE